MQYNILLKLIITMDKIMPSEKVRKEFIDLTRIDINSIMCIFLLGILCAYVFLEVVYEQFFKDSKLQVSIVDSLTAFKKKQRYQVASFSNI